MADGMDLTQIFSQVNPEGTFAAAPIEDAKGQEVGIRVTGFVNYAHLRTFLRAVASDPTCPYSVDWRITDDEGAKGLAAILKVGEPTRNNRLAAGWVEPKVAAAKATKKAARK